MENTPDLYNTLITILGQHKKWLDKRHLYTLVWMVKGLIMSKTVNLTAWTPYVSSRAQYAQSIVRRFHRWLANDRVDVHALYGVIIQEALTEWGENKLYLALDTSLLWEKYCLIRLSIIYRGRSIPLIWEVIEHSSSSVSLITYRHLLDKAYQMLSPNVRVVFLADRGFADTELMNYLSRVLQWDWRIRIKSSFLVYRNGHCQVKVGDVKLRPGQACCWHYVYITQRCFGPVHLALANPRGCQERWFIVSNQPTDNTTFVEYGLRFDIEEGFLDDKSNGFQLESSMIRSAKELSRLCFVLAIATLFLVSQGTTVVESGNRRRVDPHWFRGSSYLKIGWQWVLYAVTVGATLITTLRLSPNPDPDPAMASRKQAGKKERQTLSLQFETFKPYAV